MTDRELLELAAKAAGLEKPYFFEADSSGGFQGFGGIKHGAAGHLDLWNPLTDDGDALRLAVKLNLDVLHGEEPYTVAPKMKVVVQAPGLHESFCEFHGDNADTATRRAIVRAAAEIGRAL